MSQNRTTQSTVPLAGIATLTSPVATLEESLEISIKKNHVKLKQAESRKEILSLGL
jgi:hypothetical protein